MIKFNGEEVNHQIFNKTNQNKIRDIYKNILNKTDAQTYIKMLTTTTIKIQMGYLVSF
jgi:hypothetical protein